MDKIVYEYLPSRGPLFWTDFRQALYQTYPQIAEKVPKYSELFLLIETNNLTQHILHMYNEAQLITNFNIRNSNGKSFLSAAIEKELEEVVETLVEMPGIDVKG